DVGYDDVANGFLGTINVPEFRNVFLVIGGFDFAPMELRRSPRKSSGLLLNDFILGFGCRGVSRDRFTRGRRRSGVPAAFQRNDTGAEAKRRHTQNDNEQSFAHKLWS